MFAYFQFTYFSPDSTYNLQMSKQCAQVTLARCDTVCFCCVDKVSHGGLHLYMNPSCPLKPFFKWSPTYTCLGQIFQTAQNRCWKLACVHITFHWNIKTFFIKKNMLKVIDLLHIESDSFFLVVELLKSLDVAFYRGHLWACVKEPGELWLNCENIGCNLPRWHLGKLKKLSVPQRAGVTCAHWSDMWQVCVFFGNRKLICFLLVRWMRTCLKASN